MLALDKDDVTDCLMGTGINYQAKCISGIS
jgi:hypothetical protein